MLRFRAINLGGAGDRCGRTGSHVACRQLLASKPVVLMHPLHPPLAVYRSTYMVYQECLIHRPVTFATIGSGLGRFFVTENMDSVDSAMHKVVVYPCLLSAGIIVAITGCIHVHLGVTLISQDYAQ